MGDQFHPVLMGDQGAFASCLFGDEMFMRHIAGAPCPNMWYAYFLFCSVRESEVGSVLNSKSAISVTGSLVRRNGPAFSRMLWIFLPHRG